MKKRLSIIIVLVLLAVSVFFLFNIIGKPEIEYRINNITQEGANISVDISNRNIFNTQYWICIDENFSADDTSSWKEYTDQTFDIKTGTYYIHVKDQLGHIVSSDSIINSTVYIDVKNNIYPLYPIGQKIELDIETVSIGNASDISISSTDEAIVTVHDKTLLCKAKGSADIIIASKQTDKTIRINVTDLYTLPIADSTNKPILNKTICTSEEAAMLDKVLENKIDEAGYKTRAGVVAAARFLALEFPYKLAYFSESGRLDPASSIQCDGEGRYYHKGLYLSEDKYADITEKIYGPAYWGQYFLEDTSDDHSKDDYYLVDGFKPSDIGSQLYLMKRPNGLDCSGHVSWCYYNAGFDLGDLGAGGPGAHGMNELGEFVMIDEELLKSDRIKAGDLVGFSAHIGIVIGVDDKHIWISDNLVSGLKNTCYERTMESFNQLGDNSWKYFMLMDSEYLEDGNYTPMWD